MPLDWIAVEANNQPWAAGHQRLALAVNGSTIIRVAFSWGFNGYTDQNASLTDTWSALMAFGIVTTVGNGSETPPSAQPPASNVNPPTERFLWWEARAPKLVDAGDTAERFVFTDSGRSSSENAQGMVLAANIPSGQFLNLWATWWPSNAWDANGQAFLWFAARIAIKVA